MEFRQLLPQPATVTAQEALEPLASVEPPDARPYVIVNFVASVDGRAAFQGRSGPLGEEGDLELFRGLRERADAVLAGTGTLRVERYGRMLGDPERRARRAAEGRRPEPLACVVTRTGTVPLDIHMFSEPEAEVVLFTGADVELDEVKAQIELVQLGPEELTLTTVLRRLRSDFGVSLLLCEGGPSMFGALLHEELVDELYLTLAPVLAGGGPSSTITVGSELPALYSLEPIWVLERGGSLFLRYEVCTAVRTS